MTGYVLSADADLDLDEIWEYIAADSIDAADRWIRKLFDAFEALGEFRAWATNVRTSPRIRFCSGPLVLISSFTELSACR
jgi:plasmid stabilization system protein ParE